MAIENKIRIAVFLSVFALMFIWELIKPKRTQKVSKSVRFANNIALMVINAALLRLVFPIGAAGFALYLQTINFGVFNIFELPLIIEILLAIIFLDLVIYWQHVFFHRIPILWKLHQIHHLDPEIDVSTAGRFHALEILLSMAIKLFFIAIIGAQFWAVVAFEILLNTCAMFNHANIALPKKADAILRKFIVTPDMHRIHHSQDHVEFNRNFGFNISLWDRLFKTYLEAPKLGHGEMKIGQALPLTSRDLWLDKLLFGIFK